ncbi:NADPH:quinone oxidoreductase family protein [Litoreibacter arenae]|uniref:Oxidoreductase, zinc-binding dehydrogenase family n=1 Tax=Litoreibacter arenae DSM 19593 TaxID=1123360 RepID=S9QNK4_9RHOB|nr:NADPH:quinone oxidoreductase family protein [Litoreibacter arenae]EPX81178.1 Oxidoreductase, zinc-binding dehydrogenase family [Litoreibacter arenae DSM 19593]
MRAYQVTEYGHPPVLQNVPTPEPKPGEVLLKIEACGLNFADLLMVKGTYQERPALPFTLGMEVAGTVVALGEGVASPGIGSRVAVFGGNGGLAEFGTFPAALCVPLPDSMGFEAAAAFQVAYSTSHVALDYRAQLKRGDTLLVLGAAGGVGLTAVELGKLMGATVIASARGQAKLEVCRQAGADHLVDSDTDDLREVVKSLGGADVVYDPVGGDLFADALRACKPEARVLTIGFASGVVPQIPANHLLVKNINVIGFYWGGYLRFKPEVLTDSLKQLSHWYSEGKLHPHISHTLSLDKAAEGLELLRSRQSTGKVVITP